VDESLVALTRDRVVELTGLSYRQIDYWARTGLVQPETDDRLTPSRPVRLYGFTQLMSLLIVAELKRRRVTLQHIRKIVGHLAQRGYAQPLTQVTFATSGEEVFVQHGDGSWESARWPDQTVLPQVIDLAPLRAQIAKAAERKPESVGQVERRRGALGYKPLIAGTRVPVETVRRYLEHGATTAEIIAAYPVLREQDVEAVRRELSVA
jgi:DNA-binding transcriptional MerR regulator